LGRVALAAHHQDRAASFIAATLNVSRDLGDPWGMAAALEGSAALAALENRAEHAVRLAEAAAALRQRSQIAQSPREKAWLNGQMESLAGVLGSARYTAAQQAGRVMTVGQSFELATQHANRSHQSGLTDREQDVVRLLAVGKTNRQIAARLVIALPTVERHVSNILNKLALRSRAQVAVWAVDNGVRAGAS
jgi:DNA-binding CsgD family transcriptional regulator